MSGITFINSTYLFALIAAAAPIIIHLLLRLRKRKVTFGSVMFIEQILKQKRSHLRLKELLLLLLRTLIIVLLVLSFARPAKLVPSSSSGEGTHIVYVLDDTLSMSAHELGRSTFELAKAAIKEDASKLAYNSSFALIILSAPQKPLISFTRDIATFRSRLNSIGQTQIHAKLTPAIKSAQVYLNTINSQNLNIALATDAQATSWSEDELNSLLTEGIKIRSLLKSKNIPNIAIISAQSISGHQISHLSTTVGVKIANYQNQKVEGLELKLFVGTKGLTTSAKPAKRTLVTLEPNSIKTIELSLTHTTAGRFPALAALTLQDALPQDNTRSFVVEFTHRKQVLIIQDELLRGRARYRDVSYFLRHAINPANTDTPTPSTWQIRNITEAQLKDTDIKSADAIILLSSNPLPERVERTLADFLRRGGGVIYAPPIKSNGKISSTLPVAKTIGVAEPTNSSGAKRISLTQNSHPIFAPFTEQGVSGLDVARFDKYRILKPNDKSIVLAEFAQNHPALTETKLGAGKFLELAYEFTSTHADFPKHKSFAPFVQMVVKYAIANKAPPPVIRAEVGAKINPMVFRQESSAGYTLTSPNSSTIHIGKNEPVTLKSCGIYTMKSNSTQLTQLIACNLPAAEFNLQGTLPTELFKEGEQKIKTDKRADKFTQTEMRPLDVWAVLLALVIGIMLIEAILVNRPQAGGKI